MKTLNKHVAIEPFKKDAEEKKAARGLDLSDVTVTKLIESVVLYDSDSFRVGDKLLFRADVLRHPAAQQRLKLGDKIFLLMPEELVLFVDTKKDEGNGRPDPLPPSSDGIKVTRPLL